MNRSDAQKAAGSLTATKDPYNRFRAELLYPVAAFLVVIVLWLFWIVAGADMVRDRIEEGAAKATKKNAPISDDSNRVPLSPASAQLGSDSTPSAQEVRPPSATGTPADDMSKAQENKTAISDRFSQLGQTGDLFGGVNALFAAMALIGVFWAATMQWRSLEEGRRAASEQRFETMFFELLRLTREVLERIEVVAPNMLPTDVIGMRTQEPVIKIGASALNEIARTHFSGFPVSRDEALRAFYLQQLVNEYKNSVYRAYPSALGPYFRLLFQTFDLVASAKIDEDTRVRYSNIARGQISDGAVILLALNGLTWRGRKFVPLIERFGLLEHMHQRYLRDFRPFFRMAYRERAFQGSELRAQNLKEAAPKPGPDVFDLDPSSPDFEVTAPMTVPPDGL